MGDMAGTLQHGVRARFCLTISPDLQADELAHLREQLQRQRRSNLEMKQVLKNEALAIDAFQCMRQFAGQEAQSFAQRTRNNSEDFVR